MDATKELYWLLQKQIRENFAVVRIKPDAPTVTVLGN